VNEQEAILKLGETIAKLRKKQKRTLADVAFECGFETSNLIRIEKGRSSPSFKTLYKLAKVLDVRVKDLFDF
jgi:transcriptional regulator with XRE-family HTH domain